MSNVPTIAPEVYAADHTHLIHPATDPRLSTATTGPVR